MQHHPAVGKLPKVPESGQAGSTSPLRPRPRPRQLAKLAASLGELALGDKADIALLAKAIQDFAPPVATRKEVHVYRYIRGYIGER